MSTTNQAKEEEEEPFPSSSGSANKRNILEISKLEKESSVDEPQAKKIRTKNIDVVPSSIASIKTKTYDEVRAIFIAADVLDDEDILKMKLNGSHLYNAIEDYLRSEGTVEAATVHMIHSLLNNGKVESKSVARTIAYWLHEKYIKPKTLNFFFEQILKVDLTLENRDVETMICESSKGLIYSFGYDFHFVGREDSINQIETCFLAYSDKVAEKGQLDKQDFSIPYVAAAPGVGKSKLLTHVGELMWKKGYFPIFVSFGSGSSRDCAEIKQTPIEISLASRMAYSFFSGLVEEKQFKSFTTFFETWSQYFGSAYVYIDDVLTFINDVLSSQFKFDKLKFFIAIDEVHQLDNGSNHITTNPLNQLVLAIGRYMKQPKYILSPLLAGTYYTVICSKFFGSTFRGENISIKPFLSNDEQNQLIDALSTNKDREGRIMYTKLDNWRTNADFRHFLRVFGGFPRAIEYFLSQYLKDETRDASTSWTLASDMLKQVYMVVLNSSFITTIASAVMTKRIVFKENTVISTDAATWSYLENRGEALFVPCKYPYGGSLVSYPLVLLERLLDRMRNENSLAFFRKVFLQNSEKTWQNWEKMVHTYVYILFSLLKGEKNISLGRLFQFAKMNFATNEVCIFSIASDTMMHESPHMLQNSIPSNHTFLLQYIHNDKIVPVSMKVDLMDDRIVVVKNGENSSAGDILLFGLQTNTKETVVFHYDCKWSDAQEGVISYSQIESQMIKNQKLNISNTETRNITIVMCDFIIRDLPEQLPTDLIIVCKENFLDFFGVFSDAMMSSCVHQFMRINELDVKGLQKFVGIDEETANKIVEKRGGKGFSNLEDLQFDSNLYNCLLYGTTEKDQIKPEHARTILF